MSMLTGKTRREQSRNEEMANSLSHGFGLLALAIGIPFLILHAVKHGDAQVVVAMGVFSVSVVTLYLASTLYHSLPVGKAKRIFRVIEHSSIYLLIAGTYTPFTLGVLRGAWGWSLFGTVWGLAAVGIAVKVIGKISHPALSTTLYLLMGWLIVIAAAPMVARVPLDGLILIAAGGFFYTVGVIFFALDSRLKYGHFIWHLFVIAGTTCHYFAVLWYAF